MSDALLETLLKIANEAAEVVLHVYERDFSVAYKGPRDPVTDADKRANELICSRLKHEFPDIPIVAEESDEGSFAGFRKAERVFFVDPVDGTREFIAKNGEFVVMIGLIDGDHATHGVIHAPAQNTAWIGAVGAGAERVEPDGSRTKIRVSGRASIEDSRVVASRSHRNEELENTLRHLGAGQLLTLGSAGLKAVAIAQGDAEIYVAPHRAGKRWDACACDALVTAAGGRFTDQSGSTIEYRGASLVNDRGVVTAPLQLHEAVLERVAAYRSLSKR